MNKGLHNTIPGDLAGDPQELKCFDRANTNFWEQCPHSMSGPQISALLSCRPSPCLYFPPPPPCASPFVRPYPSTPPRTIVMQISVQEDGSESGNNSL